MTTKEFDRAMHAWCERVVLRNHAWIASPSMWKRLCGLVGGLVVTFPVVIVIELFLCVVIGRDS